METEGVDWNSLKAQDLRVDDFHIVPVKDRNILFKDPVVSSVYVQMELDFIMSYAFRMIVGDKETDYEVYKTPIAKMVHWKFKGAVYSMAKAFGKAVNQPNLEIFLNAS